MRILKWVAMCAMMIGVFAPFILAENIRYESHGKRDPFLPLIGQEKPTMVKLEDITSADDIKLEGIAVGAKGERMAIINGELLKEKKKIGDLEIKKITEKSVTVLIGGREFIIKLPEEGGGKSEY